MNTNMTLLGGWWLLILLAVTGALFLIALSRKGKADHQQRAGKPLRDKFRSSSKADAPVKPTAEMVKLDEMIAQHYPLIVTTLRHNRIIVQQGSERTLMLTIDKKASTGSRRLGEATVVNFHRVPSLDELKAILE